ncbi:MAG TPA: AI-2E family transporter [Arachnia sp.]|nr:AI-2E family transporter [Arachnia sp.]
MTRTPDEPGPQADPPEPRGRVRRMLGRAGREARTLIIPPPEDPITPVPPLLPPPDALKRRSPFAVGFLGAWGVIVAAALALAVYNVHSVLLLVVLALFLALGLNPAVEFCTRRRLPRPLAVTVVTLLLVGVLALGITAFVPVITEQATALARNLPVLLDRMTLHPRVWEIEEQYQIVEKIEQFVTSGSLINNLFGGILGAGKLVANLVFSVIVTLVLTIYFLASLPTIKETIYALAPASRRPRARYLADEIFRGVSGYITGMFVIVTVASVCSFIFMNIAGLGSYSLALAFVVAMFCFIPLVGSSLAMVSVALVGFAVNPTIGIATIIYFLIYQQFDAYVIYPNVMRRTVKVPGALVVLSAIIGGMLFGVIGAVIAIPTTAAVLLLYREMVQPALDAS